MTKLKLMDKLQTLKKDYEYA